MSMRGGKRVTKQRKARGRKIQVDPELGLLQKCYCYRIIIKGKTYVGFSSRPPAKRFEEHLKRAQQGNHYKISEALRDNDYRVDGFWWTEHPTEYHAGREEQKEIARLGGPKDPNVLNMTIGGELTNLLLNSKGKPTKRRGKHVGKLIFFNHTWYRSHKDAAKDLKVSYHTIARWLKLGLRDMDEVKVYREKQKTKATKAITSSSYTFKITDPEGKLHIVSDDLQAWCKKRGLQDSNIHKVAFNIEGRKQHKGYTAEVIAHGGENS